jgi:hypothetical protein
MPDTCAVLDLDPQYGCLALTKVNDQIHPSLKELYGDLLGYVSYDEHTSPVLNFEKGKEFRSRIDALNHNQERRRDLINIFNVLSLDQKRFTYSLFTFLVQLYLRGMGKEHEVFVVPYILGWLWLKCSETFAIPTVATYSALVLYNARVKDWSQEVTLENMTVLHSVTSTVDEVWFYKIHILLEYDGGKLFPIFLNPNPYFADEHMALQTLDMMKKIMKNLICTLKRMNDYCKPIVYWNDIRYYFEGYNTGLTFETSHHDDNSVFPKEKIFHKGGSGAQSCIFQTLDNFFGVNHANFHGKDFLESQRFYMSEAHRQFLDRVKTQQNLKDVLTEKGYLQNEAIVEKYNEILAVFKTYRDVHFGLVHSYMISFIKKEKQLEEQMKPQKKEELDVEETFKGTGGAIIGWLKDYSKDTENAKLKKRDNNNSEHNQTITADASVSAMNTSESGSSVRSTKDRKIFFDLNIWQQFFVVLFAMFFFYRSLNKYFAA